MKYLMLINPIRTSLKRHCWLWWIATAWDYLSVIESGYPEGHIQNRFVKNYIPKSTCSNNGRRGWPGRVASLKRKSGPVKLPFPERPNRPEEGNGGSSEKYIKPLLNNYQRLEAQSKSKLDAGARNEAWAPTDTAHLHVQTVRGQAASHVPDPLRI